MPDPTRTWTQFYTGNSTIAYPAEGVIRILKGSYPSQAMPAPKPGQSILDLGCGDGRHFPLFQQLGLRASGTEIADEICNKVRCDLEAQSIASIDIRQGLCSSLPFDNDAFDLLLAWNSCYYMSLGTGRFENNVTEMARVIRPGGWIIVSVPTPDCFIWNDSTRLGDDKYRLINSEYFGLRSGETLRCFHSTYEIVEEFGTQFENFSHATIDIHWFGLRYSWFVFTAEKSIPLGQD